MDGMGSNEYLYVKTILTTTSHYIEKIPDGMQIYLNQKNKISKLLEEN